MTWPFPGDSPIARARRVAWHYRQALEAVAPSTCAALDDRMRKMGQSWAIPKHITLDLHSWVSARDAADIAAIRPASIRKLRLAGKLRGRQISARKWEYLVADVLALNASPRTKRKAPL